MYFPARITVHVLFIDTLCLFAEPCVMCKLIIWYHMGDIEFVGEELSREAEMGTRAMKLVVIVLQVGYLEC